MNFLSCCWGFGSFISPFIAGIVMSENKELYKIVYYIASALGLFTSVLLILSPSPYRTQKEWDMSNTQKNENKICFSNSLKIILAFGIILC
jgi:MFS family permease